ncbi:winged helix-turn-helix domain-containing protein [Dactylosporangium sp. CA-233914]|uniref:winged helix-turn-helix domain-containing protein n=1 Tax=Dactylosporangium sp. CA-233914 TaxID=3239934 RepID=UPI003D8A86D2
MLDRRSTQALYRQLANEIRARVATGALKPGAELPSEIEIAKAYNISRDVVRQAMYVLRSEGVITTRRGHRAQIRPSPARREIHPPQNAEITARMPTGPERSRFDLPEGIPLLIITTSQGETPYPADQVVIRTK